MVMVMVNNDAKFIRELLARTFGSIYFYACLLYLVYAIGIYATDFAKQPLTVSNYEFFLFGIIHVISSVLYVLSWIGFKPWNSIEILPDYLNVVGSVLWLYSSTLYNDVYLNNNDNVNAYYYSSTFSITNCTVTASAEVYSGDDFSSDFFISRKVEIAAAVIEFICGFLWLEANLSSG